VSDSRIYRYKLVAILAHSHCQGYLAVGSNVMSKRKSSRQVPIYVVPAEVSMADTDLDGVPTRDVLFLDHSWFI
jgi:hypothetical protein